MKIYVVFEDMSEAYVFSVERIFKDAFLKEEDAQKLVGKLQNNYSDIYYEEVEVKQ